MGPSTEQVNPNQPYINEHAPGAAKFFGDAFRNPQKFNVGQYSPDAQLALQQMGSQVAVNGSPEQSLYEMASPLLMGMFQNAGNTSLGANPFNELRFGNDFKELSDPYGAVGGQGAAQSTVNAMLPAWQRGLQQAMSELEMRAPGRFSTAFASQGQGIGTQALQDLNAQSAQAALQGLGLDVQDRGQGREFNLGARGLQQQAAQNSAQNQLAARGLQQDAALGYGNLALQQMMQGGQQGLGALGLLGQLASQAANNPFQRALSYGQFGVQSVNPALSILQMGSQFLRPEPYDTVVGSSPFQNILGLGQLGLAAYDTFKGKNGGGPGGPAGPGSGRPGGWR